MNIIQKLSLRTLRKNKSSTVVTIIGIIMSVALMTGLFLFANGLLDFMQQSAREEWGDSHILFQQAPKGVVALVEQDEQLTDIRHLAHLGAQKVDNLGYNYFSVFGMDPKDADTFPVKLQSGRMPQKAGEALINSSYNQYVNVPLRVGDKVDITTYNLIEDGKYKRFMLDDSGMEYQPDGNNYQVTIVGIMDNNPLGFYGGRPAYYLYMPQSEIARHDYQLLGAKLKQVENENILAVVDRYNPLQETRVMANSNVLELYPNVQSTLRTMIYGFVMALMFVVGAAGVGLIYNSFLISISRRSRELSLLSSVGMTRRQKWQMVMHEGLILYLVALPLGILSGMVAMRILFSVLNPLLQNAMRTGAVMRLIWDVKTLLLIAGVSLLTIIIAALLPVLKSSMQSPLSGIRKNHEIREVGKPITTPQWITKAFGFSGDFAWKNVKRNKSRFRVNLTPLVLSLVLYLTMASIFSYATVGSSMAISAMQEDLRVSMGTLPQDQAAFEGLAALDKVGTSSIVYRSYGSTSLDNITLEQDYLDALKQMQYDFTSKTISIDLLAFGKNSEAELLKSLGLPEDTLKNNGAILIRDVQYRNPDILRLNAVKDAKDTLPISMEIPEGALRTDLHVKKVVDEPLTMYDTWTPQLRIIVSFDTLKAYDNGSGFTSSGAFLIARERGDAGMITQVREYFESHPQGQMSIEDRAQANQGDRDMLLISGILFFGFITIIALISIANIYNSLSASLRSRRQEFAMLQSVGMERSTFREIVTLEGLYTAFGVLLIGLPLGVLTSFAMHKLVSHGMGFAFRIPVLHFAAAAAVVIVLILAIIYTGSRYYGRENIIEQIKREYE